ncbi:MAG: hypothetical protein ACN4GR_08165 [Arenicellales bacterium]
MYSLSSIVYTHLAILYVLFIPGTLLVLTSMRFIRETQVLVNGYDLLVIFAFLFSITLNGAVGFLFTNFNISYEYYILVIGLIDLLLIATLFYKNTKVPQIRISSNTESKILYLYATVFFVIMVYNGGLLDILADSWWHMAYANRIAESSNYILDRIHLTGELKTGIAYAPLWHLQLAFIKHVSGVELPYIWHSLAPWIVMVTLFSYYRLASVLVKNRWAPLISVILFTLLLGGINSYFRVSPWPGNVSYVFWYLLIYMTFRYIDIQPDPKIAISAVDRLYFLVSGVARNRFLIFTVLLTVLVIAGIHTAQLIWYLIAFLGYYFFIRHADKNPYIRQYEIHKDYTVLSPVIGVLIIVLLFVEFYLTGNLSVNAIYNNPIKYISIPVMFVSFWLFSRLLNQTAQNNCLGCALLATFVIISLYLVIDWEHLRALFVPSMEVQGRLPHLPRVYENIPGVPLKLPGWGHQIRWGLLYSGVLAVPISIYLAVMRRDRGSYFLASGAIIGFLGVSSPYFFTALIQLIPYSSMYRIHLIIFTPIIFSVFFTHAWMVIKRNGQA